MPAKPLIGCTTYRKTSQGPVPLEIIGLMPSYVQAIVRAGGLPVLIPLGLDEETLGSLLDRLDGLLLPGGGDIHPDRYGGQMHKTMYGIDTDRDRVELALVQRAVDREKPLLTICRGTQVFNVALGGSLWEDVDSLLPGSVSHSQYGQLPRHHLAHTVQIDPNSRLSHLLDANEIAVNSLHHQGIKRLGSGLSAVAGTADGLVEGVELPNHRFAVGVQWHPENLLDNVPAMLGLFRGLVEAAG